MGLRVIENSACPLFPRWIGTAMRGLKGSITYGAFAPGAEGGINYVLYNPLGQVESVRVERLGAQ